MGNTVTFKGGVHPLSKLHHGKYLTDKCPVEVMPASSQVSISCAMNIGAPAKPCVQPGDYVKIGQMIAEAGGFMSVPVHASVSGTVKAVEMRPNQTNKEIMHIVIDNDFKDEVFEGIEPKDYTNMSTPDMLKVIQNAGCIGMGGAGFPTHVKLSIPPDKKIDSLIINGAECEPFLTADHRLMLEHPEDVLMGVKIVLKLLGIEKGYVAVEVNKLDAIAALNAANDDPRIQIVEMKVKYPQGSEKQLTEAVVGRQIMSGTLPAAAGVVIMNSASVYAVGKAFTTGMPVVQRICTVTGYMNNPKNLLVRIGTPIKELVDYCGGFKEGVVKIISGGAMMGLAIDNLEGTTTKTTSGVLALGEKHYAFKRHSECIHCGRCVKACPIGLIPSYIASSADQYDFDKAAKYHATECISCGSCSYVCPAYKDLAQSVRVAKDEIGKINRRKAAAAKAAAEKAAAEKAAEEAARLAAQSDAGAPAAQ